MAMLPGVVNYEAATTLGAGLSGVTIGIPTFWTFGATRQQASTVAYLGTFVVAIPVSPPQSLFWDSRHFAAR